MIRSIACERLSALQMKSELERENLWQAVEKLKYEGTDLKLDVKDFKKVEKAVKVRMHAAHIAITSL
jgi:hypothetical protein